MGRYEDLKAKGTKITAEDLKSVDMNTLWKLAEYYCNWAVEDPGFNRLRKVTKMICNEIEARYQKEDEYLRGKE